jgi:hypothetical protein
VADDGARILRELVMSPVTKNVLAALKKMAAESSIDARRTATEWVAHRSAVPPEEGTEQ